MVNQWLDFVLRNIRRFLFVYAVSAGAKPSTKFILTGTSTFNTSTLYWGLENSFIISFTLCGLTFAYSKEVASAICAS